MSMVMDSRALAMLRRRDSNSIRTHTVIAIFTQVSIRSLRPNDQRHGNLDLVGGGRRAARRARSVVELEGGVDGVEIPRQVAVSAQQESEAVGAEGGSTDKLADHDSDCVGRRLDVELGRHGELDLEVVEVEEDVETVVHAVGEDGTVVPAIDEGSSVRCSLLLHERRKALITQGSVRLGGGDGGPDRGGDAGDGLWHLADESNASETVAVEHAGVAFEREDAD